MAKKIKCPWFLCGSTDVTQIGEKTRTSVNLNPLHPFTLTNTKSAKSKNFTVINVAGYLKLKSKEKPPLCYQRKDGHEGFCTPSSYCKVRYQQALHPQSMRVCILKLLFRRIQ